MARTRITATGLPEKYPSLPITADAADITWTAADTTNQNDFVSSGDDLIIVDNQNAGAQTVTINSTADPRNKRTGDITTYSIGIGEFAVFRVGGDGWDQPGNIIHLEAAAVDVYFAVIPMPK